MMNNTSSVPASRIAVPSKQELGLANPSAIPRHCGHNWDDPAFRASHHKAQVLKNESSGKKFALMSQGSPRRGAPTRNTHDGSQLPNITSSTAARLHGSIQNRVTSNDGGSFRSAGSNVSSPSSQQGGGASSSSLPLSTNRYDLSGRKLAFQAWYTERVPESPIEKVRTRFVTVNFFLEDETLSIFEPTIPSSGLQGGYVLRRTRVPLVEIDAARRAPRPTDNSRFRDLASISERHVTVLDLNVGRPLIIFGQEYHFNACDDFSRQMLTALGVDVPADHRPPSDRGFEDYRRKMTGTTATLPNSARLDPMRSNKSLRTAQHAEFNGIVLRFYCVWDEETPEYDHREHKFELHYFMEDDTCSLRERSSEATGGEIIARHFLKRIRLPRSGEPVIEDASAARPECKDFFGPHDLYIGAKIPVFGRMIKLVDADPATRKYYSEKFHQELDEPIIASCPIAQAPEKVKSSSTALALLLREPENPASTVILKYELTLENPETADDALRRFVLTFFEGTGEIAIGELVQRNSGFAGGRILKRQILQKQDGSGPVTMADLKVGESLRVYGRGFKIVRLSDRAVAHANAVAAADEDELRGDAVAVSKERLRDLIKVFRDHILGRYITLAEAFRVLDQDGDGVLTEFELRMFLAKHDLSRSESEAVAMIQVLNADGVGQITFQDFAKGITYGSNVTHSFDKETVRQQTVTCRQRAREQVISVAHRVLLDRLRDKLEVRYLNVFEMFRAMATQPRRWMAAEAAAGATSGGLKKSQVASPLLGGKPTIPLNALTNAEKDCVVTPVQFRRVLVERLNMNVSEKEMAVFMKIFYPDLPETEYQSTEDVDALPPRSLCLEDMHKIICGNLKTTENMSIEK